MSQLNDKPNVIEQRNPVADAVLALTDRVLVQDVSAGANAEPFSATLTQIQALLFGRTRVRIIETTPKVGTTAGWVVGGANNLGKLATLPQSQTGSTLVIPITGLTVGDTITAFNPVGSIQSAGNTGTLTADLRKLTAAAAGGTDASIGALAAPVSVTANTTVNAANASKSGLAEVVAAGVSYYVLITSTTGATVTEEIQSVEITVLEAA